MKKIVKELTVIHNKYNYDIVVIHGGGAYGHPIAAKYDLKKGLYNSTQLQGFSETRYYMTKLNMLIIDEMIHQHLPAISLQTSSVVITDTGNIDTFFLEPLKKALSLGMIPVMYGDVVFDKKLGFTILSGDDLSAYLAIRLKAKKLLFGLDVDGIYTKDPSSNDAKLITLLDISFNSIEGSTKGFDVTGGIFHKLQTAILAARNGVDVYFFNITKENRLLKVIEEKGIFTKLVSS